MADRGLDEAPGFTLSQLEPGHRLGTWLDDELVPAHERVDLLEQELGPDRLDQVVPDAAADRLLNGPRIRHAGTHDHRDVAPARIGLESLEELEPGHAIEPDVGDDEFDRRPALE